MSGPDLRRAAAARALDLIEPGMRLGLGTGSTAAAFVALLGERVRDGLDIVGVPTQRDADGLALSSRNQYLTEEERRAARALPRALGEAAQAILDGAPVAESLGKARERLAAAGFDPVDYVELRDAETLAPLEALDRPARILAAATLGRTRLIDNLAVLPPS